MRYMWEFEVHLSPRQRRAATVLYCAWVTNITAHMVVPPALEGGPRVIRMLAVNLNQFIKNTARQVQVFVSKVVTQNQEDLYTQEL